MGADSTKINRYNRAIRSLIRGIIVGDRLNFPRNRMKSVTLEGDGLEVFADERVQQKRVSRCWWF